MAESMSGAKDLTTTVALEMLSVNSWSISSRFVTRNASFFERDTPLGLAFSLSLFFFLSVFVFDFVAVVFFFFSSVFFFLGLSSLSTFDTTRVAFKSFLDR